MKITAALSYIKPSTKTLALLCMCIFLLSSFTSLWTYPSSLYPNEGNFFLGSSKIFCNSFHYGREALALLNMMNDVTSLVRLMEKSYQLNDLNNRNVCSHYSGAQESETKVLAELVLKALRENPFHAFLLDSGNCQQFLACRCITFNPASVFTGPFSLCVCMGLSPLCLLFRVFSSSYKGTCYQIWSPP